MNLDFTLDELLDLGTALDMAAKRTDDELKMARAKPYLRPLEAQKHRYESLWARVVKAAESK